MRQSDEKTQCKGKFLHPKAFTVQTSDGSAMLSTTKL
jgi:hypothetical protein